MATPALARRSTVVSKTCQASGVAASAARRLQHGERAGALRCRRLGRPLQAGIARIAAGARRDGDRHEPSIR